MGDWSVSSLPYLSDQKRIDSENVEIDKMLERNIVESSQLNQAFLKIFYKKGEFLMFCQFFKA